MSKRGRHEKSDDRDRRRMKMDLKTPLKKALHKNDTKKVKTLLRKEWDVNAVGKFGWTPLFNAVENDDIDMMSILIQNGADLNHVDEEKNTVLHLHANQRRDDNEDTADLLLENGIDVNLVNKYGKSVLSIAVHRGVHGRVALALRSMRKQSRTTKLDCFNQLQIDWNYFEEVKN